MSSLGAFRVRRYAGGQPRAETTPGFRPQRERIPSRHGRSHPRNSERPESPSSIAVVSDVERFAFCFARTYRLPARAFGISPTTAFVDVSDGELDAHFGPWRVSTPLANITDVAVTGPYAFLKTAGPARLAITDRGLTFATNGDRGVLISFRTPVRGLDPLGILRHPELTVTVAEVDRLAELLHARSECAGAGN